MATTDAVQASKWVSLKRCLGIVRRLGQGPASRSELTRAVREVVPDAYGSGSPAARRKQFERDMQNGRDHLGVITHYDPRAGEHALIDPGPFLSLALSPEALRGLAFLLDTFDEESAAGDQARPLLEAIQGRLPPDQLRQLKRQTPDLEINLRHLDQGDISPRVWADVRRAAAEHHVLQFDYISPEHDPPERRTHVVEPYRVRFQDGHWHLHAYCRRWTGPHAHKDNAGWLTYRLTRIQAEGLEIWPDKFPADQRRRRLVPIRYRLGPVLHRGGVSPRFEEMEVSPVEADGWVTVTAKTDDLFRARRVLLAYGENCEVLEPPELRRGMARAAHEMAERYAGVKREE